MPASNGRSPSSTAGRRRGVGNSFSWQLAKSGTVIYNINVFGDPAPGQGKYGYFRDFTWCAPEPGSETLNVPAEVAYGVNGSYYYNWGASGTIAFINAAWGDPSPGNRKSGYYMPYT